MKTFVRQVPQGKALCLEDAVDVLTSQDNVEGAENYATALHLLAHAEVSRGITTITQGYSRREESFRRIRCRIYNHDEYVPFPCLVLWALMVTSAGTPSAKPPTSLMPN
jgi:nuclear pore complex protein Nup133